LSLILGFAMSGPMISMVSEISASISAILERAGSEEDLDTLYQVETNALADNGVFFTRLSPSTAAALQVGGWLRGAATQAAGAGTASS
jgi:hypothetical protein